MAEIAADTVAAVETVTELRTNQGMRQREVEEPPPVLSACRLSQGTQLFADASLSGWSARYDRRIGPAMSNHTL